MLRARKKDVRIKPNRKLDKRSSRGMLYENEELRLRTIEINAEVERGQLDIKKLRRENDHLRREMWALRDEYERLEKLIKHLDLAGTGPEHQQRNQGHSDGEDRNDDDRRSQNSLNGSDSGNSDGDEAHDRSAASEGQPRKSMPEPRATVSNPDLGACHCQHDSASYVECGNPDMDNIENYQKAYGRMPRQAKVFVATQHLPATPGYESIVKPRYSSASMEDEDGYAACAHPTYVHPVMMPPTAAPPPVPSPTVTPVLGLRPSLLRDPVVVVEEELLEVPDESASSGVEAEDEPTKSSAPPDTPSEDGHFNLDHLVNVVRSFEQDKEMHKMTAPATQLTSPDSAKEEEEADAAHSDSSCGETSGTATIKRRPEASRQRHRSVAIIERPVSSGGSSSTQFYSAKSSLEGANEAADTYAQPIKKSARQATALLRRDSSSSSSNPPSPTNQATSTTIVFLNNNDYTNGVCKTQSSGSVAKVTVSSPTGSKKETAGQQEEPVSTPNNCLSVYPLPEGDASASLLRLHAVDPHTVSFDAKEHPTARSVTVQEVIDQLEQQLDPLRCHVRGVRMLEGGVFFISLNSARSLHYLMRHSFRLRGHRVKLTDISAQTWIVALSGVPHYISDATVGLLLAAFGQIVGDVERRFFRGVDTGERLVRFRLKGGAKLPKHITVGGCRIQVRRMSPAPNTKPSKDATFEPEFISTATIVPEANSAPKDEELYGKKGSAPKIGRSFEYRSQLKVDLRMSAEVPVPPDEAPVVTAVPAPGTILKATPACNVCEQQPQSIHPSNSKRQTPPPPPLPPGHRCRQHHEAPPTASVAVPAAVPAGDARNLRESPPKSRASVNFEESIVGTATSTAAPRGSTASGIGRSSIGKSASSTSPANGILRKSVSGEDPALESATDAGTAISASAGDAGKNKARPNVTKKTARSFSLVDTFRVNKERKKSTVGVETLVESNASATNQEEAVRTVVVRRDSAESSSRSSRGSRKSNELPWCGCWGNGCL